MSRHRITSAITSVIPLKADIHLPSMHVRLVPQADIDPMPYARMQAGFAGYAIIAHR
jgi:hypothetical protein